MLKLEIKFNDAQMRAEHKYAPEAIYAALDKSFAKYNFRRETLSDGTICYYGNGTPRDYGTFGRLITTLKDKEWFMAYLVKWLWYNRRILSSQARKADRCRWWSCLRL